MLLCIATKEPSIYNSSEPVTFLQTGDDVVLFCQSEGYPLPVPYWSKVHIDIIK